MIVADTNLVLRGVRSNRGASGYVLKGMLSGDIPFAASPAVILEYEDVLKRPGVLGSPPMIDIARIDSILDAICAMAVESHPRFRFRPFLDDPKDDLFVECALAANADLIVTDDRHFRHPSLSKFGLRAVSAREYLIEHRNERKPK
jgi:predicted nucleic acid-binding protein